MGKIIFVTAQDVFDKKGNGGTKCSKRNYDLLAEYFGEDNISILMFSLPEYTLPNDKTMSLKCYPQPQNVIEKVFAVLFGCKKYMPYDKKSINKYLDENNPEVVFFDGTTFAKLVKRTTDYKQIVFFNNVEADYAWNKVKNEGIQYLLPFLASLSNERHSRYADKTICLNERDAGTIKEKYNIDVDYCWPITFDDCFDGEKISKMEKTKLLFLGSYFGPNADGVDWFIKNVMSELKEYTLDVVGKGFEETRDKYSDYRNVNIIGTVENPSDYYYTHEIVIMPILYGAGMKVKTAEAMMYGNTIVATDEALEGYDVDDVKGIFRCNSAEEFIQTLRIIEQSRIGYTPSVRDCFVKKYESSVLKKRVRQMFEN